MEDVCWWIICKWLHYTNKRLSGWYRALLISLSLGGWRCTGVDEYSSRTFNKWWGEAAVRSLQHWIVQLLFMRSLSPLLYSMYSVGFSHDALPPLPSSSSTHKLPASSLSPPSLFHSQILILHSCLQRAGWCGNVSFTLCPNCDTWFFVTYLQMTYR